MTLASSSYTLLNFTKPSIGEINPRKESRIAPIYILLNQNSSLHSFHDSFDVKIVVDVYNSSYPVYSDLSVGNIDLLSTEEVFFIFKRRGLFQQTINNVVSSLARLTFYDNLLGKKQVYVVRINGCPY